MGGSRPRRRTIAIVAGVALTLLGVAGAALAFDGAQTSKVAKVKVRCPSNVTSAQRAVTCRGVIKLRRGARGPRGLTGATGRRGATGARGATGRAGVSGYEVVNQTFAGVAVPNSGAGRGLSAVQTIECPGSKRALSGGFDLGTNAAQNVVQPQVTVSLSGPTGTGGGWSVQLFNNSGTTDTAIDLRVYAICATTG